mmetsp:Transcript_95472/g.308115  ORF Transcript_95472/g.308115 Transcript_95472/m.308115 type:complete len:241 (-) Transcript_95472:20-742(-)
MGTWAPYLGSTWWLATRDSSAAIFLRTLICAPRVLAPGTRTQMSTSLWGVQKPFTTEPNGATSEPSTTSARCCCSLCRKWLFCTTCCSGGRSSCAVVSSSALRTATSSASGFVACLPRSCRRLHHASEVPSVSGLTGPVRVFCARRPLANFRPTAGAAAPTKAALSTLPAATTGRSVLAAPEPSRRACLLASPRAGRSEQRWPRWQAAGATATAETTRVPEADTKCIMTLGRGWQQLPRL